MSLLMDALKQAEHAKRDKSAVPLADAPAPAPAPITAPAAELSLAPAEPAPAPSLDPDAAPPAQTPVAAAQMEISAPEPTEPPAQPDAARPAAAATGPQAAARLLAAGAGRTAAGRRRQLVGAGALAGVLALAIGGYYYYAALAQPQPYLNLPAATAPLPTEPMPGTTQADTAAEIAAAPDLAGEAEANPADAAGVPTHTPWRAGPPPTETVTEDWQPAPVDPRAVRGEPLAATVETPAAAPAALIRITRGSRPDGVNAALQEAYAAFRAGRWADAELAYRDVLGREAGNRDAHLGLAALAVRAGRPDVARAHYRELLRRDPTDAAAYAALVELDADPAAGSESELKLRLAEQPHSAALQFALANLYAAQRRWPLAQQAYFEAQRLAPDDPDYAFNLAVSLEHLGQSRAALDYYRRALALSRTHPAQLDADAARRRITALDAGAQP